MLATGRLPITGDGILQECTLGNEFSGKDRNGKRIFGVVKNHGMATTLMTDSRLIYDVPDHWTLEQAATIPTAYMTAYYSLIFRGKMKKRHTILIHAGTGGVGLAAINIALHIGATVYTTVGSQEKREYLKKTFPVLTDRNIANSRDVSFKEHIMNETDGKGVDIVLNSLAEEKLQASVQCLAENGTFLEIGKYDMVKDTSLGMYIFMKNISFHGISLERIFNENYDDVDEVRNLINEGLKSGAVKPLPATIFPEDKVSEAFKFLASAKHIGKVLLKIREEESERTVKPQARLIPASPKIYFSPQKVYIIVGGLGGFGLELSNWLVLRGARKIVLVSRAGVKDGYQSAYLKVWQHMNSSVIVNSYDCTEEEGAEELIKESQKLGEIAGIFNLAMVLKDALFQNMTEDDFQICCKPKINITKHLDKVSRKLCPELEYFVVFSSVACGRGNAGQSNYGFANSVMERICEARKCENLPALAIQWGPIGDVGVVAELMSGKTIEVKGLIPQKLSSCLSTLDVLLLQSHPVVSSVIITDKNQLDKWKDKDILDAIGDALGISNIKELSPQTTIAQIGGDSFMISTIQQTLERDFSIVMTTEEVRNLTLGRLREMQKQYRTSGTIVKPDTKTIEVKKIINVPEEFLPIHVPQEVLIKLPSLGRGNKSTTNIFFVHPLQGNVTMMKPLASLLSGNIWGLQCTRQVSMDSVFELAEKYFQQILSIQKGGHYIVCSYSYGVTICLQVGHLLENTGNKVTYIMIDGGPNFNSVGDIYMKPYSKSASDYSILGFETFLTMCGYSVNDEIHSYLLNLQTQENRVYWLADVVAKDYKVSQAQLRFATEMFVQRFSALRAFRAEMKVSGQIVLIKSSISRTNKLKKYYNLDQHSEKEVKMFELEATHEEIIRNKDILNNIKHIIAPFIENIM